MKHISIETGRFAKQLKELEIKYYSINSRLCRGNFLWIIGNEQYMAKRSRIANLFYKASGDLHKEGCNWLFEHNTGWDQWGYRTVCKGGTHWMEQSKEPKKGQQLLLWREPSEHWMSNTCPCYEG